MLFCQSFQSNQVTLVSFEAISIALFLGLRMDDNANETGQGGEQQPSGKRDSEEMEGQPEPTASVKKRKRKIAFTSVHQEFDRIENFFNARYRVIFAN